jgi:hypothetical protein
LHLSLTFWLLVLFRSHAKDVRELSPDNKEDLHKLQREVDNREDLESLRAVATGKTTWQEFERGSSGYEEKIMSLMQQLLHEADMLCTAPSRTVSISMYRQWENCMAKGVAIDEAAAMKLAELYCVWGTAAYRGAIVNCSYRDM